MNLEIKRKTDLIKGFVENVNDLISELHVQNVEVRFLFKEASNGLPPCIEIYKLVEHVDYL
jgi:hypothetical protein